VCGSMALHIGRAFAKAPNVMQHLIEWTSCSRSNSSSIRLKGAPQQSPSKRSTLPSSRVDLVGCPLRSDSSCSSPCMQVALDVARGLVFLHSRRIVHFDLKSPNVLLTRCVPHDCRDARSSSWCCCVGSVDVKVL
jgi:serine/threonine protein kinase